MKRARQPCGYTLIEVMLVTAVTLLIASASVVSFAPLLQQVSFEEGANRFESLLRFARAEAANSGHKIQIQFETRASTNTSSPGFRPVIVVEQDPFNAPGLFALKPELTWMSDALSELAWVESVLSLDPPEPEVQEEDAAYWIEDGPGLGEASVPAPITFYPDGSSDSAEFVLAPAEENDGRRQRIRLVGLTGEISRSLVQETSEFESEGEPANDQPLGE